jgi:hypothetical protein
MVRIVSGREMRTISQSETPEQERGPFRGPARHALRRLSGLYINPIVAPQPNGIRRALPPNIYVSIADKHGRSLRTHVASPTRPTPTALIQARTCECLTSVDSRP